MDPSTTTPPSKRVKTTGQEDYDTPPPSSSKTSDGPFTYESPILTSHKAERLERLTLVSLNVAGCQPSADAPRGWNQKASTDSIREEILSHNPDIIALQECPGTESWADTTFLNYTTIGATRSHADNVILLVKKGIQAHRVKVPTTMTTTRWLPAVISNLTYKSRSLLLASVHLAPFKEGEDTRRQQIADALSLAVEEGEGGGTTGRRGRRLPLIMAGDMNMRQSEDVGMKRQGWTDFWQSAGSERSTKFTWDTMNHGTSFNRYYGDLTREYNARYDRIYFQSGTSTSQQPTMTSIPPTAVVTAATSSKRTKKKDPIDPQAVSLKVDSFELIANKPVTGKTHFLSDHFGIATTFELEWPVEST